MYTWEGMKKISYDEAVLYFESNKEIYLLHDNDTESLVDSLQHLNEHKGEYGIEVH